MTAVQTNPGHVMGTPAYMSPEQARADVSMHALISSAWVSCSIRWQPGNCHSTEQARRRVMASILHDIPEPPLRANPELPTELGRIIGKALEKDRDLRYQSASELRGDLKRLNAIPIRIPHLEQMRRIPRVGV